jgi:YidC/Oxa1 family membrane protein insertase
VQHYFVSAWLVGNQSAREFFTRRVDNNLYTAGMIQPLPAIAPGAQQSAAEPGSCGSRRPDGSIVDGGVHRCRCGWVA